MTDVTMTAHEWHCKSCGHDKPLEAFQLHASGKPHPPCKACRSRNHARWRAENAEALKIKKHLYYVEHREEIIAKSAQWAAEHPEQRAENMRRWSQDHAEERHKYNQEYAETNAEHIKAQRKKYREENAAEICCRSCEYGRTHPEVVRNLSARKRARKRNAAINDLTPAQFQEICEVWNFRCAYCPKECKECKNKTHRLQQEHITAMANGGNNTVPNVVPACQDCNYTKHTGPAPVWIQPLLLTVAPPKSYKPRAKKEATL